MDMFDQYINQAINDCLAVHPNLDAQKLKEHLYNVILTTTIDNLTDEQFLQIKDLPPTDPSLAKKIEEFSSQMPNLLQAIEDKINSDCEYIKQNGQLPQIQI